MITYFKTFSSWFANKNDLRPRSSLWAVSETAFISFHSGSDINMADSQCITAESNNISNSEISTNISDLHKVLDFGASDIFVR